MADRDTATADSLSVIALLVGVVGLLAGIFGVGLAARALDEADDGAVLATGGGGPVEVSLSEFTIEPASITLDPASPSVQVTNDGTVQHDFAVVGHDDLKTEMLDPGDGATLDLSSLDPGSYEVICTVPGHADAGMRATLVVGGEGSEPAAPPDEMTPDEMDQAAKERTEAFPAETEGKAAQRLEPTIAADGAKEFELTAEVIEWEVEPGKVVEAWGYNGTAPGPTIKVAVGDRVRVTINNELHESTSIHWHGIDVPNEQDGVPDVTQPQIKVGESYTYEFDATIPAVGMYHAHSNSQLQVPMGLMGAFIIGEQPYPEGRTPTQEHVMILNDAGNMGFTLNGKSFPATEPYTAKVGETILIHYMNEGLQAHPMHLHGPHQTVIAKDGWAYPQPWNGDTINVAPGERYSVLVTPNRPGVWVFHCHILTHAERPDGFFGMTTALIVEE